MKDENEVITPFEPFIILYKVLRCIGYYKLKDKQKNKYCGYLHYAYRFLVCLFVIIYNMQHILFVVKVFEIDKDQSFEALMIEIPQWNLLAKLLTVNRGSTKLDKLTELMNDPIFAAKNEKDKKLLRENRDTFHRLTKSIFISVSCTGILWTLTHIFTRMTNKNAVVPIYVPFSTDTWTGFGLSILLEHGPVFWTGFGHMTLDILIACHYSQATVQLKIIRYNLEHLCDSQKVPSYAGFKNQKAYKYIDDLDGNIKERFNHYVKRYAKVVWFVNETTLVFNSAISVQFLTASSTICLVVYKLSLTSPRSVEFIFLVALFLMLQLQVVLYCFFGELLKNESTYVTDSAYLSDWLSISPGFRRKLLMAMTRWTIPITPLIAGVVPLSLNTFINLLRGAFKLYTVLETTKKT